MRAWLFNALFRYWAILILLVSWQALVTVNDYNSIVAPSPMQVGIAFLSDPEYFMLHAWHTLSSAIGGLILGIAVGITVASLSWATPLFNGLLMPMSLFFRSIPIVAIIPIIVRLVGYGSHSVIMITAILTFFPCYLLFLSGLESANSTRRDFFASLNCRPKGIKMLSFFRYLALPSAMPSLLVSVRLLAPTCILVALVTEFLMGLQGLGYVMTSARSTLRMDVSWTAALISCFLSVGSFLLASAVEQKYRSRWVD